MLIYFWINEAGFLAFDVNWFVVPVFVANWLFRDDPHFWKRVHEFFFLPQSIDETAQKAEVKEFHNNDELIAFQSSWKLFSPSLRSLFPRVFTAKLRYENKQRIRSFLSSYIEWLFKSEQELASNQHNFHLSSDKFPTISSSFPEISVREMDTLKQNLKFKWNREFVWLIKILQQTHSLTPVESFLLLLRQVFLANKRRLHFLYSINSSKTIRSTKSVGSRFQWDRNSPISRVDGWTFICECSKTNDAPWLYRASVTT